MNAATINYNLCALAGFGLLVAGVYLLQGLAWALLAGSVSCFSVAAFIRRGLISE